MLQIFDKYVADKKTKIIIIHTLLNYYGLVQYNIIPKQQFK